MKKVLKISNKILVACLALVGISAAFTACSKPKYGMSPEIHIKGKVTDKVTDKPIKGIKVTNIYFDLGPVPAYGMPPVHFDGNFAFTDENGNYTIFTDELQQNLSFQDIDGEENGLYNDTIIALNSENVNMALTPKNQ